jgi:diacylglycerol kinase family enzyme
MLEPKTDPKIKLRRFAIYLNQNARRVSQETVSKIEELLPPDDIYVASTPDEAMVVAGKIFDVGYETVFVGGGDGTVCLLVEALWKVAKERGKNKIPVLGVLSMGTGNAISRMVSSGNAIADLRTYIANPSQDTMVMDLVSCEGRLFAFGGAGIDAEILQDYDFLKAKFKNTFVEPAFRNAFGYVASFLLRTGPRRIKDSLKGDELTVRMTSLSEEGFCVDGDGNKGRFFGMGDVIYEGRCKTVIVGTIPIIGYGFRALPAASKRKGFFQVRVANISVLKGIIGLRELWLGTYRGQGIMDFYARKIRCDFSKEVPLQVQGEVLGYRRSVVFEIMENALPLLRFI